jgi:hypothetical protein
MEMPKPTDEHRKLHALVGEWEGAETLSPSPWGPGGAALGKMNMRMDADGFFLLQDYVEEKDGRVVFRGHGVFGYDAESKTYAWFWFDSMGLVPEGPSRGTWQGDTLLLERRTERGSARYTHRLEGDGSYFFSIENSFDGEKTWNRLMSGTYRRKSAA